MSLICVRYIVDAGEMALYALDPETALVAARSGVEQGITGFKAEHPDAEWDVEIMVEPNESLKDERQLEMGFEMTADWNAVARLDKDIRSAVAAALAGAGDTALAPALAG